MKNLKIGIVEDDLLIAESIAVTLNQIGYRSAKPVRNYTDALNMLKTDTPDLLLIDINLNGEKDGIDLAVVINRDYGMPFIFLTANSDAATINRAKEVAPYGYLVKPFNEKDLFTSIEIAFSNYSKENKGEELSDATVKYLNDVVFIKEGDLFQKLEISEIQYLESDNVYLNIYTAKRNYVARAKLEDFLAEFTRGNFLRVHRSYAVNVKHLESINTYFVKVAGKEIPVHKTYRQGLLQKIKSIK